ncbi:MAG: C10 family peptidase [Bacteroidales bacterium]|nr:C10 family peptidase [Bacteroidales bacterium]
MLISKIKARFCSTFMRFTWLLIIIQVISFNSLNAKPISKETAAKVATNFLYERINQYLETPYQNLVIADVETINHSKGIGLYLFKFDAGAFVIISADDAAIPVVGYGFGNVNTNETKSPALEFWLENYANQIGEIQSKKLASTSIIDSLWAALVSTNTSKLQVFSGKSQQPLLLTTWDQGAKYNELCPSDVAGPGGHVYAGCVAVAMAQVMNYYKYPTQGTGSYSYYDYSYGMQTVDYGNTTYDWYAMTNSMPNAGNAEIAKLLYHCGVSVDMNYSPNGSGAWSNNVVSALKNYYNYSSSVYIDSKNTYSDAQWSQKLIQNLDSKIPLYYHGYPAGGGSGHAFNLDGYQGSDYFHFNWGWSGSYNGYFYLDGLNPGGSDFNIGQGAIFDITPPSSYFPISCNATPVSITSSNGNIFDGSGPVNYATNTDCRWLISPSQIVESIKVKIDRLDLNQGDTLFFYDGETVQDSLLFKLHNGNTFSTLQSTGDKILVRFVSDQNFTADGFDLSFSSNFPVYCTSIKTITDSAGIISDGSDTNKYNNGILCKWMIESGQNSAITIHFTEFDTESGQDWVVIYDPTTSPVTTLGQFSGNQIPPAITATNGKMMIVFATNEANQDQGWKAFFHTGTLGIDGKTESLKPILYPNPTNNTFSLSNLQSFRTYQIEILTLDGKNVFSTKASNSSEIRIDCSHLETGLYLVKIQSEIELDFIKLVVE